MSRATLFAISAAVSVALIGAALVLTKPALTSDVTASYEVRGDGIVLLQGDPAPWHDAAWERWVELVPPSDRWRVARFEAIAGSSDGQVEPISESLQVWTLRISELEGDVLDVALIHELGHLVSLGPDQIFPNTDPTVEAGCITYFSIEGCAIPGGVFDRFVAEFWDTTNGWKAGDAAASERYLTDPDAYLTRYAATNPGEDLAETFVFFVYRLKPEGDSIAEEKIRLLWEFPELVELRSSLRRNLTG